MGDLVSTSFSHLTARGEPIPCLAGRKEMQHVLSLVVDWLHILYGDLPKVVVLIAFASNGKYWTKHEEGIAIPSFVFIFRYRAFTLTYHPPSMSVVHSGYCSI